MADDDLAGAAVGPAVGNRPEPVPRVRGNLPPVRTGGDVGGHEVPPEHPMEWYERANPRTQGGGSMKPGPWGPYPKPPAGFPSRDVADLAELHRQNPTFYGDPSEAYQQGGSVTTPPDPSQSRQARGLQAASKGPDPRTLSPKSLAPDTVGSDPLNSIGAALQGYSHSQGGMVKHGSATRITCRTKHG